MAFLDHLRYIKNLISNSHSWSTVEVRYLGLNVRFRPAFQTLNSNSRTSVVGRFPSFRKVLYRISLLVLHSINTGLFAFPHTTFRTFPPPSRPSPPRPLYLTGFPYPGITEYFYFLYEKKRCYPQVSYPHDNPLYLLDLLDLMIVIR